MLAHETADLLVVDEDEMVGPRFAMSGCAKVLGHGAMSDLSPV